MPGSVFSKRLFRSLLGRNLALLIPMVLLCFTSAWFVWIRLVQFPRVDDAAALVSQQISMINQLFATLTPEERRQQLINMHGIPDSELPTAARHDSLPEGMMLHHFFAQLSRQLPPGVTLHWEYGEQRRLWVRLRKDDGWWIAFSAQHISNQMPAAGVLVAFIIMLFPVLCAAWIHWRLSRPLNQLAAAARTVATGEWPAPVPPQGPEELATVTRAFNHMVSTLARSDAAREEMLAGISHDIRTPLTKLRMVVAEPALFQSGQKDAERYIAAIDAILGQFIDFARKEDNEVAQPGNLNHLVEALVADYAGLGVDFTVQLAELPEFTWRPVSVQRALMNLMQNAVKYGQTGLHVSTRLEGPMAVVEVADSGPGIPPEQWPDIVRPFYRGKARQDKGAGLGLSIVERIARQHGGQLRLSVSATGGLAVAVLLPLNR